MRRTRLGGGDAISGQEIRRRRTGTSLERAGEERYVETDWQQRVSGSRLLRESEWGSNGLRSNRGTWVGKRISETCASNSGMSIGIWRSTMSEAEVLRTHTGLEPEDIAAVREHAVHLIKTRTHDEFTGRPILPKDRLRHGAYFKGRCRNATIANVLVSGVAVVEFVTNRLERQGRQR